VTRSARSARAVTAATSAVGLAMAGSLLTAAPAHSGSPAAPGQLCADGNYFVIEYVAGYPGSTPDRDGSYERAVPTRGGCASSWAHGDGQLSTSAITAQCRTGIEPRFGPYPFTVTFPGAGSHQLTNRADCIELMLGVSSGRIDPGVAPLFPGGQRPVAP
jgi:hypothetical protein